MSAWIVSPAETPSVRVRGDARRFPVRRIFCVGRNYAAHAREMGSDPTREPPFFFSKPADAVTEATEIAYPQATSELHHEVELVVALQQGGRDLEVATALECVFGYAVGLDLTRRDLQHLAKAAGRPWDFAKGFDHSAPLSEIVPVSESGHPARGRVWLEVNGALKQQGDLDEMIWSVAEVLAEASRFVELRAGDLVFTGTPSGVGALAVGDVVTCGIEGVGELRVQIGPKRS